MSGTVEGDCTQPWLHASCEVFSGTATGFLGKKRASMLDNPLLHRNPYPGAKPKIFTAPQNIPKDFTYGTNYRDYFNVGHALTGWVSVIEHQKQINKQVVPNNKNPDYLSMNRAAVSHGISTAKELRDFRDTHEVTRTDLFQETKEVRPQALKIDKNRTFGLVHIRNTPMKALLSSHYQDEWIRSLPVKPSNAKEDLFNQQVPKYDFTKYYQNRTCDLRNFMAKTGVENKTPAWKMPRFTRHAKPSISTFRSSKEADAAWKNYGYDKIGREGGEGQGITIKAENHIDYEHCKGTNSLL